MIQKKPIVKCLRLMWSKLARITPQQVQPVPQEKPMVTACMRGQFHLIDGGNDAANTL